MNRSVFLAAVLTSISLVTYAGPNRWTSSGPEGAIITQIATDPSDPSVAYAVVWLQGVFKTVDGGQRWSAVNKGLTFPYLSSFAVQPDSPSTLYESTNEENSRIFVSGDAGRRWSALAQLPDN